MELPLIITLLGACVVGIVMATDFPMSSKTMWLRKYPAIRKRTLLDILRRSAERQGSAGAASITPPPAIRAGDLDEWLQMHQQGDAAVDALAGTMPSKEILG